MDRCGRRLSTGCASVPDGGGCSLGHARDHGRGYGRGRAHDRDCSRGRGREVLAAWGLLRNVVAGDYLAIALKVHAASEHQAGFYVALQLVTDGFVRVVEQIDNALKVAPEVGAHRNVEILVASGRHGEAFI